jgi:DNA polymerase IV
MTDFKAKIRTDFKAIIISELDTLRRISVTEEAGVFKSRVYASAIKTLSALPFVRSVEDLPPSQKGDGLGKEVRIKVQKIIEHSSLNISETARATAVALEAFQQVYGVGPKKAQELIKAGYTTIAGLRTAVAKEPKLLNKNQQIGLRYYEQLLQRIPRAEMDQHAALLMAAKPASLEGVIVGSYRRGKPDSGDIDMLLRTASASVDAPAALQQFVHALQENGYIQEVLAHGDHKCMAICTLASSGKVGSSSAASSAGMNLARRLDLLITPPAEFPFAVFYFTGSDTFNVAVRNHALSRGYTLNEHALTQLSSGKQVSGVRTEQELFKLLKLRWVEPVDRTGPEAVVPL